MISVAKINQIDKWSDNLEAFDYSMFITPHWLESMRQELQVPIYLDLIKDDVVIAKIAGMSIGDRGSMKSKLHFYAGPAPRKMDSKGDIKECLGALLSFGKYSRYNRVVVLSYDYSHHSKKHHKFLFRSRSEYIIDLTRSKEEIGKAISRNVTRNVKKASQRGYVMRESRDASLVDSLVNLLEETKRVRISKGYSDYEYFYFPLFTKESLQKLVKSDVIDFFIVEKEEKIHAILALMSIDNRAYTLFIGASEEGYRDGVPSMLDYLMISSLHERHIKYLNFGGIPDDKSHAGLIMFKKKLGCSAHKGLHGSTGFIQFPYFLLNPAINLIRVLPDNRIFRLLKKGF